MIFSIFSMMLQYTVPKHNKNYQFIGGFSYAVSVRWEREQAERRRSHAGSSSGPVTQRKPYLTFSIEDFNRYFCCCARRVGSMFFLVEKKDGSPIVVAGPCWPFCSFVTVPLIVVLSGLVGYFIVSNPNTGLVSLKNILA